MKTMHGCKLHGLFEGDQCPGCAKPAPTAPSGEAKCWCRVKQSLHIEAIGHKFNERLPEMCTGCSGGGFPCSGNPCQRCGWKAEPAPQPSAREDVVLDQLRELARLAEACVLAAKILDGPTAEELIRLLASLKDGGVL